MADVRRLGPDDWTVLKLMRLDALGESPDAFGSTLERESAFTEADWRHRLRDSAVNCVAFTRTGEPVGIAGAYRPDDEPTVREVVGMWVRPAHRGTGLADLLLVAVLDWSWADGASGVRLWVADGNDRARRCYVRRGFRPTGRRALLRPGSAVDIFEYALDRADRAALRL
jgi:RimJ/RimL family protein N-acetyltransferase